MPSRRSWKDVAAPAGLAGLAILFLWEVAFMTGVPVARDMQLFFLPQKHIVWEALQAGELPVWSPLIAEGRPLLANFQSALFYPPTWLYAALPFLEAFNWLLVLHVVLGGVGAYLFARQAEFDRWASGTAGVAFMLGGYFASLTNLLNVLQTAAWAPLLGVAVVAHLKRRSAGSFAGVVAAHLAAFLAGEPTTFLLAAAVSAAYAAVWIGREGDEAGASHGVLAGSLAAAAVVVAGLAAAQILPTLEYVAHSTRGAGLPFEQVTHYALKPLRLLEIAVPPDYGDPVYRYGLKAQLWPQEPWLFSIYAGVGVLVLSAYAWRDRGRRPEVVFWSGVTLAGIVLGLGPSTPLFRIFYDYVPGFSAFRYPERFYFLSGIGFAMLAAHGSAGVRREPEDGEVEAAVALVGLSTALAAKVLWTTGVDRIYHWARGALEGSPFVQNFPYAYGVWTDSLDHALLFLVVAVVLVGLYRKTSLREGLFAGLLVLLVALDLGLSHRDLTPVVDPDFYRRPPAVMQAVDAGDLRTRYRIKTGSFTAATASLYNRPELALETKKWLWQQTMQPNLAQYWGFLSHYQGDAIHLPRAVDRSRFFQILPVRDRLRLLRLASVKYVYSAARFDTDVFARGQPLRGAPGAVYTFADPLPRAYVAEEAVWRDSAVATLNEALRRDFDLDRTVALLRPDTGGGAATPAAGRGGSRHGDDGAGTSAAGRGSSTAAAQAGPGAEIVSDTGERVEIRISPRESGHLVLTDYHYPGWTATVDGERRPIRLANYFYRAVRVEPGDRRVVFRYRSDALELGEKVSAATMAVFLLGLAGWKLRRGA